MANASAADLPRVRVSALTLAHRGAAEPVVRNVSFDLAHGEVLAIVGPSGVGKSTVLAALAGLVRPAAGSIMTRHGLLVAPTPRHAIVFQDGALFPWLTLRQNVLYALVRRGLPRAKREALSDELLARVRLDGHGAKFPHELSGGMKKRVAFARALATDPEVVLLDEPFSALDVTTRTELHRELLSLFGARGTTVVIVTHDLAEAAQLADRVLVLDGAPGTITLDVPIDVPRPRAPSDARLVAIVARLSKALARPARRSVTEENRDAESEAHDSDRGHAVALGARVASVR